MTSLFTDAATIEALANGATVTATGVYSAAATQTNNFTVQASTTQAHGGTKSMRVQKGVGNQTGRGTANSGAVTLGSTWREFIVGLWYYPDVMAMSSVAPNTVHTLCFVSSEFAINVDHASGIKVKAQIIGAAATIQAVTTLSPALTNQTWNRIVAIYRRVSATTMGVRLFVNDVESGVEQIGTHTPPSSLAALRAGISDLGEPAASVATISDTSTLYLDDITLATVEPIPTGAKITGGAAFGASFASPIPGDVGF